ncbi:MAG: ATP-binding protein [Gammaproteobacteria bacterium]|nr:ATP-binding protein [Gammaproteobacteria bacterium]
MELGKLKEALGDETFAALETYVTDLKGQRDEARKESISGRKQLRAKVAELEKAQGDMLERLGVDDLEGLEKLDIKGQADANKQFGVKVSRLEKQLAEVTTDRDKTADKYRKSTIAAKVGKAFKEYNFIDEDMVAEFVNSRVTMEDGEIFYQDGDTAPMPLAEGLATLVQSRPGLVKKNGARGSGHVPSGTGSTAGQKIGRADWDKMSLTAQKSALKQGATLTD